MYGFCSNRSKTRIYTDRYIYTDLWSMDTRLRSSLCLLLNMTSLCGISSREGGPNGVHSANRPNGGGSSDLRFWPWITFIRPRTSSLCASKKKKNLYFIFIFKFIIQLIDASIYFCTNDNKTLYKLLLYNTAHAVKYNYIIIIVL